MKCALCVEDKELCDSHLIPEFFYEPSYEEPHRYYRVSTNPDKKVVPRQKGIWEKLLCRDCEDRLTVLENYARRLFKFRRDWKRVLHYNNVLLGMFTDECSVKGIP